MAGVKIVDLPALGRDLINTDLLEVSLNGGGSRKITGQEIMNASKLAIGSTPIVAGTVGRLLFQGTGNVLQQSSSLFWDNTGFLGIGTSTPVAPSTYNGITINSASAGSYIWFQTGGVTKYTVGSEGNINYHNLVAGTSFLIRSGGSSYFNVVQSTGNVQIGTTTDAGFRLDVNGTARVQGNTLITQRLAVAKTTAANNTLEVQNPDASAIPNLGVNESSAIWFGSTYGLMIGKISNGNTWLQSTRVDGSATAYNILLQPRGGNVLINTTTDDGFRLDVNGTARVKGVDNNTINIDNAGTRYTTATLSNNGTGKAQWTFDNNTNLVYFGPYSTNGGLVLRSNGTDRVTIFGSTGNVGINTTTDAGFRLDVNGTARVKDVGSELSITSPLSAIAPVIFTTKGASGGYRGGYNFKGGFGGTAGNTIFIIDTGNTDATSRAGIGNFAFGDLASAKFSIDNTQSGGRNAAIRLRANYANTSTEYNGIDFNAYTGTDIGGFIGSQRNTATSGFGADIVVLATQDAAPSTYLEIARFMGRYNSFYVGTDRTLAVPSAKMQIESTTQGFLPPRMTNAQRAAIASPAVGLIVYCTDATEGLYVYKSTGWTFMV